MVNFYDCFVIEDCTNNDATVQDVVSKYYTVRNNIINPIWKLKLFNQDWNWLQVYTNQNSTSTRHLQNSKFNNDRITQNQVKFMKHVSGCICHDVIIRNSNGNVNFLFFSTEHINHIRKVAGVDHIGIGADFNGVSKYVLHSCTLLNWPNSLVEPWPAVSSWIGRGWR